MGAAVLGIPGTVALAACGDKQVITREVPVERVVVKEVEVDRVVTRRVEKVVTQEVEKILRHEVAVEKVVENVVTKEVETLANVRHVGAKSLTASLRWLVCVRGCD